MASMAFAFIHVPLATMLLDVSYSFLAGINFSSKKIWEKQVTKEAK